MPSTPPTPSSPSRDPSLSVRSPSSSPSPLLCPSPPQPRTTCCSPQPCLARWCCDRIPTRRVPTSTPCCSRCSFPGPAPSRRRFAWIRLVRLVLVTKQAAAAPSPLSLFEALGSGGERPGGKQRSSFARTNIRSNGYVRTSGTWGKREESVGV